MSRLAFRLLAISAICICLLGYFSPQGNSLDNAIVYVPVLYILVFCCMQLFFLTSKKSGEEQPRQFNIAVSILAVTVTSGILSIGNTPVVPYAVITTLISALGLPIYIKVTQLLWKSRSSTVK